MGKASRNLKLRKGRIDPRGVGVVGKKFAPTLSKRIPEGYLLPSDIDLIWDIPVTSHWLLGQWFEDCAVDLAEFALNAACCYRPIEEVLLSQDEVVVDYDKIVKYRYLTQALTRIQRKKLDKLASITPTTATRFMIYVAIIFFMGVTMMMDEITCNSSYPAKFQVKGCNGKPILMLPIVFITHTMYFPKMPVLFFMFLSSFVYEMLHIGIALYLQVGSLFRIAAEWIPYVFFRYIFSQVITASILFSLNLDKTMWKHQRAQGNGGQGWEFYLALGFRAVTVILPGIIYMVMQLFYLWVLYPVGGIIGYGSFAMNTTAALITMMAELHDLYWVLVWFLARDLNTYWNAKKKPGKW